MAQGRYEIRRSEAEKLLSRIDCIAVLGRERPRGSDAFDIRDQQASGGQWNDAFDIPQPQRWALHRRQSRRDHASDRHAQRGQAQHGCKDDRKRHNPERNRFPR